MRIYKATPLLGNFPAETFTFEDIEPRCPAPVVALCAAPKRRFNCKFSVFHPLLALVLCSFLLLQGCTAANGITVLLGGINAAAEIIGPILSADAAKVVDTILADTQTADTIWDGGGTVDQKISGTIAAYANVPSLIPGLPAMDQLIIGGVLAAVQAVLAALQALNTPTPALASRAAAVKAKMTFDRADHAELAKLAKKLAATRLAIQCRSITDPAIRKQMKCPAF